MPFYRYKARNRDKYIVTDIIEAINKGDAVRKLKKNDMVPLDLIEIKINGLMKTKDFTLTSGVSKQDLVFFLSQLHNLLHAGLGIIDCLKIIIDQTDNKYLKKYLINILQDIRNGSSFYQALGKQKRVFPKLMVEMVKVGEVIGNLEEVVMDLHNYFKKQSKTQREIRGAMSYPIFLLFSTFAVTVTLMLTVFPSFKSQFADMGKELPSITKFVMSFSDFLQNYIFHVILGIIVFIAMFIYYGTTPKGKLVYSKLALKVPIFKELNKKSSLVKISQTYSTLLKNSVNAIEGLEITKAILNNEIYKDIIDKALINIQNGIPMSKAFEKHWAVDPVFSSMMAIGEETATLYEMLGSIGEYYNNEMDVAVEKLKKMMEPLMVVFLAGIVGVLVLAIMLPMFGSMGGGLAG